MNNEIQTLTFKEVHEELEKESLFLFKEHDVKGFSEKAKSLNEIGFTNSIATKLYDSIAQNINVIKNYQKKYHGQYKFILKPQLERVCEKYNLYVRQPEHFLGDIPEKNIQDLLNFEVDLLDIINSDIFRGFYGWVSLLEREGLVRKINPPWEPKDYFGTQTKYLVSARNFKKIGPPLDDKIKIAAVESLFSSEAFKNSKERIIETPQLEPKGYVELDPIILCETLHGYLIITAWGDEANDELIANQNHN